MRWGKIKLITGASEDNFAARKARYQQTGERPPFKVAVFDPGGMTLAGWLVCEMTRALGRRE